MARALLAFYNKFGLDILSVISDVGQIAEGWGCSIEFVEGIESTPMIVDTAIKKPEDWERIEAVDPRSAGRMPVILKAIKILSKEVGNLIPIVTFPFSPITVATWLRGLSGCLRDLLKNKDLLHKGLERISETMIEFGKTATEAGAHALLFTASRATGDIFTLEQYKEIAMKYDLKVLKGISKHTDVPFAVHACGNEPFLELIVENYPIQAINFWDRGSIYNLKDVKTRFGDKVCIMGGLDQTRTLIIGSPEDVMNEAKDAIKTAALGGRFILTPGCELSAAAPDENIKAISRAAEKYGKYPIKI